MSGRSKAISGLLGLVAIITLGILLRVNEVDDGPRWHPWDGPAVVRDLSSIADDTLRVLALRDPLIWEERPKAITGLEFELLQRFARKAKLKLKVVPFDHPDSLLAALWQGRGDVGAMQAAIPIDGSGHFSTSASYASVRPMIVRQRPDAITDKEQVGPRVDSLVISVASPFAQGTYTFGEAWNTPLDRTAISEDELLIDVVLGRETAAIISDLRAGHEAERFPVLEFSEAGGKVLDMGFVVRASSPELLKALNDWLTNERETEARNVIVRSYADEIPEMGALRSRRAKGMHGDSVSPFDDEFREHAGVGGWDWRLLAAMAWKETRFDSTVTSRQGATGIMQFMPGTAARMGLDSASSMDDHIRAATQYMNKLDMIWLRAVPDKQQRLRFVLASYNAGPGHIIDAQRLADQLGLDPARWEGNVERAVLLLAKPRYFLRPGLKNGYCKGNQVFHYVRGVLTVYKQLKGRKR